MLNTRMLSMLAKDQDKRPEVEDKQAFPSTKDYIKQALGPERFVQWVMVVVAVFGGWLAIEQFKQTRQSYLWTNVYNLERDTQKLFDEIAKNEGFTNCFSPDSLQNQPPGKAPRLCEDDKAREQFRSLLIFYRFLAQLGNNFALPDNYHAIRLRQFCKFLSSPTGLSQLRREIEQGPFQPEFADAVRTECRIPLRSGSS